MQYVLTEEEYKQLHVRYENQLKEKDRIIQELCLEVCKYKPILGWWNKPTGVPSPWDMCPLFEDNTYHENYCDDCPVTNVCPNPFKEWSK